MTALYQESRDAPIPIQRWRRLGYPESYGSPLRKQHKEQGIGQCVIQPQVEAIRLMLPDDQRR